MITKIRIQYATRKIVTVGLLVTMVGLLGACGKKEADVATAVAPFSEAGWGSSVADVKNMEGNSPEIYDSIYGGTTYSYPKEFLGRTGTIKYMFDDQNALMNVAWAYGSDSEDELYTLYDEINQSVNEVHGESGYQADSNASNYGNVWYLESGDIILSTMVTSENRALQYAYLNPAVSNKEITKEKT